MTATETKDGLVNWIKEWLSQELGRPACEIDGATTFVRYGMDSVQAMMLVGDLEDRLNRHLPPTLAWDYPTPEALAAFLEESTQAAAVDSRQEGDQNNLLSRLDDLSEEELDQLLENHAELPRP